MNADITEDLADVEAIIARLPEDLADEPLEVEILERAADGRIVKFSAIPKEAPHA